MQKMQEIAGSFDHNGDGLVQSGAHHPMKHIKGFTRSHQMLPLGECLHHIALAADIAMIFVENTGRPKLKVMRIMGGRGHWSICVFVLYLYQNINAKKIGVPDENTQDGIRTTFLRKFHFVLLYIRKPFQISNISQPYLPYDTLF
jgi:hypothetical protein